MSVRRVSPSVIAGRVTAPGSKSYTHRALVAGFLSGRPFTVLGPLDCDDTRATLAALRVLGARVGRTASRWTVDAGTGPTARRRALVDCRESGTTLRFLLPLAARGSAPVTFRGTGRLSSRPVVSLLESLEALGMRSRSSGRRGLPLTVRGPIHGGIVRADVRESSQFLSGLLLTLPTLPEDSEVYWEDEPVSWPYVQATVAVLRHLGVMVGVDAREGRSRIPGGQRPRGDRFRVPGDASSAAYLWAAAALTGGKVRVDGVSARWPQADRRLLSILTDMGGRVIGANDQISAEGPLDRPIDVDLTDAPDLVPLVGVLASAVPGRSRIRGAPQLVGKESDRRAATVRLVRAFGAEVKVAEDEIAIRGVKGGLRPVRQERSTDHRLVMSATVGALAANGPSTLGDAEAVRKSFPTFWTAIGSVGARTVRSR